MEFCLCVLHLILNTVMAIQLVNNLLVIVFLCQVGVFKEFKAEGGQRGFKLEVNKGKLGLCVPNYVAIYTKDKL